MYFPFLRGKKYELQTLSELAPLIKNTGKVTPILEPLNLNPTTRRILPELNAAGVPFVFMINPQVGDLTDKPPDIFRPIIETLKMDNLLTLGYFINKDTTIEKITSLMEAFPTHSFAFVHTVNSKTHAELVKIKDRVRYHVFMDGRVSSSYLDGFKDSARILIKDCFNAQNRNADYDDDEFFSELFFTYKPTFYGFGDFLITGSGLTGGGPAHAVALHLTYLKEPAGKEIWIRHFISDDTKTAANVEGKYFQALRKLVKFLDEYTNTAETIGAHEYRLNFSDEKFHNLGYPKKLSMKHHIELITQII
jgi:hypothetical protein